MSQERETVVFKADPKPEEAKPEEVKQPIETREQRKAKLASILERGITHDRLSVDLPSDVYGEWVRNDEVEIYRMQTLGFQVDHEYASKRALHTDGNKTAVVGDVIFMTTSRENKELIDEVEAERVYRKHNPKKPKEDADFESQTKSDTGGIIPTINESKQRSVRKEEIAAALNATK